ncbi:MAG TPA: MarR family transcriptional regulator [Candidatus Saccharimonadales bacterium]
MSQPLENIDIKLEHISSLLASKYDNLLFEKLGISYSQYKVLVQFRESSIIRQNIIAKGLGQTEASITRQLHILNSKGLISKSYDPKNRKVRVVTLTRLGRKIKLAAENIIIKQNYSLFNNNPILLNDLNMLHSSLCEVDKHNY